MNLQNDGVHADHAHPGFFHDKTLFGFVEEISDVLLAGAIVIPLAQILNRLQVLLRDELVFPLARQAHLLVSLGKKVVFLYVDYLCFVNVRSHL